MIPSAADLDRFVCARAAALRKPGIRKAPGLRQRAVLRALQDTPMSVGEVLRTITVSDWDTTVNVLAGLAARGLIELHDGRWGPPKAEAAA